MSEATDLNLAIGIEENIRRLNASMEHIFVVHGRESPCYLVDAISAEVLRVILIAFLANFNH